MPQPVSRLQLAEQRDKEALDHVKKAIEWEESAIQATTLAEREKCGEKARKEREAAMNSLKEANIEFGQEAKEFRQDANVQF
ncbi:MAG: hypothetical protein LAN59_01595 [Acidobacteriia bacterium]|nr:hypothetical protein [Terriglobia bacterium]